MTRGSCLCGEVRWSYDGEFSQATHCHCSMCRKGHAAPFATYAVGPRAPFAFTAGEAAIRRYESSPGFIRSFCGRCGSVLPNPHFADIVAIPMGNFDEDPGLRPSAHIFVRWKAPWYPLTDALTRHDNYPGADAPAVDRPTPGPAADGVLGGSCLCGDVAFTVSGEFSRVFSCHCSRCRKARAAAHTVNGFTAAENLQFIRGTEQLVTYRVPEARFFAHVFCARCGSGMPRADRERGFAVVPFGALDDDPGRYADCHIFVGSKAPWFEITDGLPQFESLPTG